jgi:bifunctional UDP-N-acetylglucosamine pyrophosphorylase/glucosamine-1-phosphate N-acetyltransferase
MRMKLKIINVSPKTNLHPLAAGCKISDIPAAGLKFSDALQERLKKLPQDFICAREDFWPSKKILAKIAAVKDFIVLEFDGKTPLAWTSDERRTAPRNCEKISLDRESRIIEYPWDFLFINEEIIGDFAENEIFCEIRKGVNIDGFVKIGKGTVLLPGVYIEGNAAIGENCKIGPNCYIRGNTSIGNECHIGQAVEIKNSIIMDKVSIGHLSYVGDSIVGNNSNLGAGTITANFRHDGKNHRSMVDGELKDTGRRKFGAIIGNDVHTGIHTSIYPGRKIWNGQMTLPGAIVQKDIHP